MVGTRQTNHPSFLLDRLAWYSLVRADPDGAGSWEFRSRAGWCVTPATTRCRLPRWNCRTRRGFVRRHRAIIDGMRVGVVFPQTEIGADVGAIRSYAAAVSDLGYTHIMAYDHVVGADPAVYPGWNGPYDID